MAQQQRRGDEARGASGLIGLASDVSADIAQAERQRASSSSRKQTQPPLGAGQEGNSSGGEGASAHGKWIALAVVVIGAWLISTNGIFKTNRPISSQQSASRATVARDEPRPARREPEPVQPIGKLEANSTAEEMPPVGRDVVFSHAQIRYCVAEKIRIEATEGLVDTTEKLEVDRFNARVRNYNSRCGSFRHRSGALESARADVELRRRQIEYDAARLYSLGQ